MASTSFESLALTALGGSIITVCSIIAFGITVKKRFAMSAAPRCVARPPNTIYYDPTEENYAHRLDEEKGNGSEADYGLSNKQRIFDRGNPYTGWIQFVLSLSYDELLSGVRGTGTRDGGMGGNLLKVNLDGIVMLRFHSLCLRVSILVCALTLGIVLPLNWTGRCYGKEKEDDDCQLTNYEQTTFENIPAINDEDIQLIISSNDIRFRVFTFVLVSWIICFYVCKILEVEWEEMLALRRAYYLECNHFHERKKEIEAASYAEEMPRKPWIPHPASRDTVPNIELYSVLVAGVPILPSDIVNNPESLKVLQQQSDENSSRFAVDWQLAVTTAFFEHCVPPPRNSGFTSSVAAVTILPDAKEIATAWRKWYVAAAIYRRLQFVTRIIERKRYQHDKNEDLTEADVNICITDDPDKLRELREGRQGELILDAIEVKESLRDARCDVEQFLFQSDQLGAEQRAVYRREYAQSAASCCPFGCREDRVKNMLIDDLDNYKDMLTSQLATASRELRVARDNAIETTAKTTSVPVSIELKELYESSNQPVSSSSKEVGQVQLVSELRLLENQGVISAPKIEQGRVEMILNTNKLDKFACNRHRSESLNSVRQALESRATCRLSFDSECFLKVEEPPLLSPTSSTTLPFTNRKFQSPDGSQVDSNESKRTKENLTDVNASPHLSPPRNRRKARRRSLSRESSSQWNRMTRIRASMQSTRAKTPDEEYLKEKFRSTGIWQIPTFNDVLEKLRSIYRVLRSINLRQPTPIFEQFEPKSSFAVVTFTTRQAAATARRCIVDSRGKDSWFTDVSLPTPPLADSSAWDLRTCRGCCRPVTLTLGRREKFMRRMIAHAIVSTMFIFYAFPISYAVSLINESEDNQTIMEKYVPKIIQGLFPHSNIISGVMSASLFMLFFALCPLIFKALAVFGSNATSALKAEYWALQAYWWFMVVTAFSGSSLLTAALAGIDQGKVDTSVSAILREISDRLSKEVSATWINWIILRTTIVLPVNYLLQGNTILFHLIGWNCCARAVRGGGPGGQPPYRIYIDSGVVFLCMISLSIVSPCVAPCAFIYFLFCAPLWRRQLIFVYRPKFDGAGFYWPFLFEMCISSLFVMQILLCTALTLKKAFLAASLAILPAFATYVFRNSCRSRYLQAYNDVGLMQSSMLDMWANKVNNHNSQASYEDRENYRKFLVDCHKAAYIPVCIAERSASSVITTEPAQVLKESSSSIFSSLDTFGSNEPALKEYDFLPVNDTMGHKSSDSTNQDIFRSVSSSHISSDNVRTSSPADASRIV